jgi:hypothetical protein
MAKFTVYLTTDLVGSRVEREFEIDDAELDGLSDQERDTLVREYAQDELANLYDWGYEEN